jgi:hypothetical protein
MGNRKRTKKMTLKEIVTGSYQRGRGSILGNRERIFSFPFPPEHLCTTPTYLSKGSEDFSEGKRARI